MLEAMAALGLQALVLASLLATSTGLTILAGEAWKVDGALFAERQVEHLIDTAVARAGAGPSSPPPIASATQSKVVLYADLNGDGAVDTSTSEQTELELRYPSASTCTLMHRLGRQGMTVEEGLPPAAQMVLIGRFGAAATVNDATGFTIPRRGGLLTAALPARIP